MMAKHNDCKEQWLQRGMTAKKDDCKKTMTAIKQWLQRTVPCKEQFWKEVWSLPRKLRFHIFNLQILKKVSHESFHCTTSTCRFWRKLARKLRFHIFNSQILKKARAKAFLCTTSTCRFWKGSLARKLRFHQLAARSWGQACAAPQTWALPANSGTNPCVLILPDSKLYFLFYDLFYWPIPIT